MPLQRVSRKKVRRKPKPESTPRLRKHRGKAPAQLARKNARQQPNFKPYYSRKPLPDEDKYPKDKDGAPRYEVCQATGGEHVIDWYFSGWCWSKSYGNGEFDLACEACGEVGHTVVMLKPKDITWG